MNKPKTNADKYKISDEDADKISDEFAEWHQDNPDVKGYGEALYRFLQAKVKPTLTEDEKVILSEAECFQKGFSSMDKIHRTKDGDLYITKFWIDFGEEIRLPYKHLFQFIQPRRRI